MSLFSFFERGDGSWRNILPGVFTVFGANSNQGQIVTNIGYYLGLLVIKTTVWYFYSYQISSQPDICTVYTHSTRTLLRYLHTAVTYFRVSENINFCGCLEEDERITSGNLRFRRLVTKLQSARAACACTIRVSTVWKLHRSFLNKEQHLDDTRA